MATEEEQYLNLRRKFQSELVEIATQIEALEDRRNTLEALLEGEMDAPQFDIFEPAGDEDRITNPDNLEIDHALDLYLRSTDGAARHSIDEALMQQGYTKPDIDKALKRCKRRGLIINEGRARSTVWYSTK